jgi:hypothetical protein
MHLFVVLGTGMLRSRSANVVAGDEALKVVLIWVSLNLPYGHHIHVQNFTVQVCHTMVLNSCL